MSFVKARRSAASKHSTRPKRRPARIDEVKRHVDGSTHRFACDLLMLRPHVAVVRYRHRTGRSWDGFHIPRGSVTYGFMWTRRSYSMYRMHAPDGSLICFRYDVLEDVRISEREISYVDLFLDIWFAPDGTPLVEDEDEVEDFASRGLLTMAQVRRIERTKDLLLRRHPAIVREAEGLLAPLVH